VPGGRPSELGVEAALPSICEYAMKLPKVPWKNMAAIGDIQNSVRQDQAHAPPPSAPRTVTRNARRQSPHRRKSACV
jgi:hypothetical protein